MRISDWSSDVCSSDLRRAVLNGTGKFHGRDFRCRSDAIGRQVIMEQVSASKAFGGVQGVYRHASASTGTDMTFSRSEERRVGEECVRTCGSRWSPSHSQKKQQTHAWSRHIPLI